MPADARAGRIVNPVAFMRARARWSVPVLAILVSACGVFEKKEPPPGPCPRALILADAATITQFRDGTGRDLLDVSHGGRIARVHSDCTYDMKKDGTGVMKAQVFIAIDAERGPANRNRIVPYRYFVTLSDSNHEPITKGAFDLVANFADNTTRVTLVDDTVEMTVPIRPGQSGRSFIVLVGFQLTEDQLQYNRQIERERQGAR